MVFAIEPMFTLGTDDVVLRGDGWTYVTADGSRCAQIEHTVAITEDGPRILTEYVP
jgi:methionyl aminopeptidase